MEETRVYERSKKKRIEKIKESQKSGAATEEIFKPAVWWFDLLQFLDVASCGRSTSDNLTVVKINACLMSFEK